MTTPKGKGVFPEDHPLALGVFGYGGHPSAAQYLQAGYDTLVAVGTSLNEVATNGWRQDLRPRHTLIQIDVDHSVFGRAYDVTLAVRSDASTALDALVDAFPPDATRGARSDQHGIRRFELDDEANAPGLGPHHAIAAVQAHLPPDTIFTCDIGEHLLFAVHYLRLALPDTFVCMMGFGSMTSGLGAAVGVQLAHPGRRVVSICGDGGFVMGLNDVTLAARERLPIVFLVLNDERYGMVELGQKAIFGRTMDFFSTSAVDLERVARGLGARYERVADVSALRELEAPAHDRRPLVLDVRIDRRYRLPRNERVGFLGSAAAR
jgi:acetolactate synthase-1/2/3 large subunit